MSLPQTVVSLAQNLYATGTHQGNPVPWPTGATQLELDGIMSAADASNTNSACGFQIWVSRDNGKTFQFDIGFDWTGAVNPDNTPNYPIAATNFPASNPPTHVRADVLVPAGVSLSVGASLTIS